MKLPENQIPEFIFSPVGLAGQPCTIHLNPPRDGEMLRSSWMSAGGRAEGSLEVQCLDLPTLMKKNGHGRIDLLKIDIEGAEYGVLDQILREYLPVRQILVEYHHSIIPGIPRSRSIRSILKLVYHGYRLIDHDGNNHTFISKSP